MCCDCMFVVQEIDAACVCSERRECLWCLERTAAHTLLSFSNTTNNIPTRHTNYAMSSHARHLPNRVHSCEVEIPSVGLLSSSSTDLDVNMSDQSSVDDATAVDDTGLTPRMRQSRLAQVCEC